MSRGISSLVVIRLWRSGNLTVVFTVGSPKLHAYSREVVAFLSESINRVIITGRYLRCGSDPTVSEGKRYSDIHDVSTVARRTTR